ncbi:hypothetical protein [Pandoraea commovens]|uniref:Uncharacterized protein n=1 Tax=Pandoraea commovens TaxID=2508289 RepID=A0ABY5QLH3_9BURK|nr:hypothetical protein [Pandoraea commovens]UVA81405.1 hypothetical protein NTU39_10525 [Pandoraea commovens]
MNALLNAGLNAGLNAVKPPPSRSFRQALRPQRFPHSCRDGFGPKRRQTRRIADIVTFRTATQSIATPALTAVACCACVKGIEKICVVTSNDADFVR